MALHIYPVCNNPVRNHPACNNPACNNSETFYVKIPKGLSPLTQLSLGRVKRPSALPQLRKTFLTSPSLAGEGQKSSSSPSLAGGGEKGLASFRIITFGICAYVQDFYEFWNCYVMVRYVLDAYVVSYT
jgi:hypothetical protein